MQVSTYPLELLKIIAQELHGILWSADAQLDDAVFEDALDAMRLYIMFAFAQALLLQSLGHHVRHLYMPYMCVSVCRCELKAASALAEAC